LVAVPSSECNAREFGEVLAGGDALAKAGEAPARVGIADAFLRADEDVTGVASA